MTPKKILLKDLNPYLTCTLCGGYFIDATALVDCLHVFCRGCILRYFENCKQGCPTCNTVYKKKNATFFKPDTQLQSLVYKIVPGLYSKEMQRRDDFYRATGDRAGSSCSDDSVLGDMAQDHEDWISSYVGDNNQFYSADDSISLSLEYYQACLDRTTESTNNGQLSDVKKVNSERSDSGEEAKKDANGVEDGEQMLKNNDRRYLQCPAAVTMWHLQKFVRMKYALTAEHRVDIIYAGEVLPQHFSLMDVAYTFKWSRTKPMRFFYRIFVFTPVKVVRPIKIVTTSSSTGKQLHIVPVKPEPAAKVIETPAAVTSLEDKKAVEKTQESEENYRNKEQHMANLQLLSKNRLEEQQKKKEKEKEEEGCIYEYEEPDKEEIKRFAEKRDREWALQKHLDEQQEETRHVSKKRKKNKHSKNESVHKKRKLHAEITSNEVLTKEESLKLKVKLTPHNGHKHKHHKSAAVEPSKPPVTPEVSSKEKLLQMRAVRHKHVSNDEKSVQTAEKPKVEPPKTVEKSVQSESKPLAEPSKKETEPPAKPAEAPIAASKTLRSDFTIKTAASKELATAQAQEKSTEQAQKAAFLKTFQSHADKPAPVRIEAKKPAQILNSKLSLERKIANLKQQCTIEPKKQGDNGGKVLQQYNTGFTVSKIEAGVKRKSESEEQRDKRPSLEITLINPQKKVDELKTAAPKRPPPATIPLERIKKSMNFKSGISIIPKPPERCDNIGALDLSKPSHKIGEVSTTLNGVTVTTKLNNSQKKPPEKSAVHNTVNLQMLSKVALEHPTLKQPAQNKPKQPLPSLQTLKAAGAPSPQQKSLPKLNEINKSQFRLVNPQVRNIRANQSQNVRTIPNPSLLVRQQNQNRMNSISQNGGGAEGNGAKAEQVKSAPPPPAVTTAVTVTEKPESNTTKSSAEANNNNNNNKQ